MSERDEGGAAGRGEQYGEAYDGLRYMFAFAVTVMALVLVAALFVGSLMRIARWALGW